MVIRKHSTIGTNKYKQCKSSTRCSNGITTPYQVVVRQYEAHYICNPITYNIEPINTPPSAEMTLGWLGRYWGAQTGGLSLSETQNEFENVRTELENNLWYGAGGAPTGWMPEGRSKDARTSEIQDAEDTELLYNEFDNDSNNEEERMNAFSNEEEEENRQTSRFRTCIDTTLRVARRLSVACTDCFTACPIS